MAIVHPFLRGIIRDVVCARLCRLDFIFLRCPLIFRIYSGNKECNDTTCQSGDKHHCTLSGRPRGSCNSPALGTASLAPLGWCLCFLRGVGTNSSQYASLRIIYCPSGTLRQDLTCTACGLTWKMLSRAADENLISAWPASFAKLVPTRVALGSVGLVPFRS